MTEGLWYITNHVFIWVLASSITTQEYSDRPKASAAQSTIIIYFFSESQQRRERNAYRPSCNYKYPRFCPSTHQKNFSQKTKPSCRGHYISSTERKQSFTTIKRVPLHPQKIFIFRRFDVLPLFFSVKGETYVVHPALVPTLLWMLPSILHASFSVSAPRSTTIFLLRFDLYRRCTSAFFTGG